MRLSRQIDKASNVSNLAEFTRRTEMSQIARAAWMGCVARADPVALRQAMDMLGPLPTWRVLRAPQVGLVMARGRAGATGDAFNLGEVTATRCAVEVEGATGYAYVLGRDRDHALAAAVCDALMQTNRRGEIEEKVLRPLAEAEAGRAADRARKAAATRVEFFTLVRGG
jgi:alpha-D-ribose 1-methylphosphonate 5-triphosphate synthase subunit PhnG